MAVVAQLVEPSVVVRVVAGSSPVVRPIFRAIFSAACNLLAFWPMAAKSRLPFFIQCVITKIVNRTLTVRSGVIGMFGNLQLAGMHTSGHVEAGETYRRRGFGSTIEEAQVLRVAADNQGIPHVFYQLQVRRGSESPTVEQRTLAFSTFLDRYNEKK
jgi:hypothetical protein